MVYLEKIKKWGIVMKKYACLGLMFSLLFLGACSSNTNGEVSKDAPSFIKETWEYFTAMSKVTDAIEDGENVEVAFDKHFPMEEDVIAYIESTESNTEASEEEQIVNDNIHLMHLKISTMAIESFNASIGGDSVDFEQYVYELQVPRHELEKVYKKYGLEYKK